MPIESTTDHDSGIVLNTASGMIVCDEIIAAIDAYYRDRSAPELVLWDFSGIEAIELSSDELRIIATYPMRFQRAGLLRGGKRAIVVPSDLSFGLSRMLGAFKSRQEDLDLYEVRSFRTRIEALAWLTA